MRPFAPLQRPLRVVVRAQVGPPRPDAPVPRVALLFMICIDSWDACGDARHALGADRGSASGVLLPTKLAPARFLHSQAPKQQQQQQLSQAFGGLAALLTLVGGASPVFAADFAPPPTATATLEQQQTREFPADASLTAPALTSSSAEGSLPEGTQWRYSEFINAVKNGKVERVRFSKDGTQLQLTAVDGRRALVVLPNDPELVDILAKAGVDISGECTSVVGCCCTDGGWAVGGCPQTCSWWISWPRLALTSAAG